MAETRPIRAGEEIDVARLSAFLSETVGLSADEIEVEQFPGGSSNLTYLVRLGRNEYVLRRPPFGNTVRSAHDMQREFGVLSKLSAAYAPAPKPLALCTDESVIGSEFYLMERRHGLIIRGNNFGTRVLSEPPAVSAGLSQTSWDAGELGTQAHDATEENFGTQPITADDLATSQDARLAVCRSFNSNLVDLHSLDYSAIGLENLGRIDGYNRRQVEGWTKRYFAAKTDDWDAIEKTIVWLGANIPAESGASLIHNDYKFDNVMLDPEDLGRITAVLDWEMVTVGDPLMDLGTTLGYWMSWDASRELLSMPFNPRVLMENITRQQLVDMYFDILGRKAPDMLFYYVFGTFKIAVIAQQIYARFVRGYTQDERFANFNKFVASLGMIAASAISRGSV